VSNLTFVVWVQNYVKKAEFSTNIYKILYKLYKN